jgi:hypothetical protein
MVEIESKDEELANQKAELAHHIDSLIGAHAESNG